VLELYDSSGTNQIWEYNGGGTGADEVKSWSCPASGIYYVKVTHANPAVYGMDTGYDLDVLVPAMPTCGNGILSGKVKDIVTLAVLSGVEVVPVDGNGIATVSDANGNYRTTRFVCGTQSVNITTEPYAGYEAYSGTGSFTADVTTSKNVKLTSTDLQPVAGFSGTPVSGDALLTVNFTDNSTGGNTPLTYQWDFDNDGTTDSTLRNPSANYYAGTYAVKLTVTDFDGDMDTLTRTDYISVCYSDVSIGSTGTYTSLQAAYNDASNGGMIQGRDVTITENLNLNRPVTVTIQGGYNCDHSSVTGMTTITGNIIISEGKVTIENIHVQ